MRNDTGEKRMKKGKSKRAWKEEYLSVIKKQF